MIDREKVIKGLEFCTQHGPMCGSDCNGHYERYTDDGYVIKLVDEYRSKCPYGKCETGCVKTLAKDALELLKEQELVKDTNVPNKWISVKDRLPETSRKVFVYCDNGYITDVNYSAKHKQFNNYDVCEKSDHEWDVTHWMPMPEPPEEESHDQP